MRSQSDLHEYQCFCVEHIIANKAAGLFVGLGLGKTATTLTAVDRLMYDEFSVYKPLIIAPKKVTEHTWKEEIANWDHLKHLKLSIVLGTEKQRIQALRAKADIYIINRENTAWLVAFYQSAWPFDMLVIDELSSFKNSNTTRFKALSMARPRISRVVGLTGTPAPNGLIDLWSQVYLLDQGERLGKTVTGFRDRYFRKENEHTEFSKYEVLKDEDREGYYEQKIYNKISDICISMKASDYLELPKRIDRINLVHLPPKIKESYDSFEKKLILSLDEVDDITAVSAAVLSNKLLQFANGAIYDDDKVWHEIHKEKLEALEEDMEAANGEPVIVFYSYKHDLERILQHFKAYKPVILKGAAEIYSWNKREISMLLAHPASAGHGLNLQDGGNLIEWFGSQWSLELYLQAVARLDRQGQKKPVINTRIVAKGTIDEDVIKALENKDRNQNALLEAVKARIKIYKP